MTTQKFKIQEESKELLRIIKSLDKKVVTVLISTAILLTISWYYTSRLFFHLHFYEALSSSPNVYIYEFIYWYAGDFITLFVVPFLIIKFYLKERMTNYGITLGDVDAGLKITLLFLIIMIPIIWFVTAEPAFALTYPLLFQARDSWKIFFVYELGLFFYLFAWEFIWRGFLLFGLKEKFGYYAVIIQMIPFLILHYGKPDIETFGAIFGGLALGILAYRTLSIYYCVITHAGIMFSIDLISTLRYRANDFGIGINSLLNIIKQII